MPIRFIKYYKDILKINVIPVLQDIKYLDDDIKQIILDQDKTPGKVALVFMQPYSSLVSFLPKSKIKICYTMTESHYIHKEWVDTLNKHFDATVVPSQFLVTAYKKAGLKIPIFNLPIGLDLDNYFKAALKSSPNKIFTFGISANFGNDHNKNQKMLIKSFLKKFKNNDNIRLRVRGNWGDKEEIESIKRLITKRDAKNVEIEIKPLSSQDYLEFMKSLDCYVLVSKGEGFSITPREALALGIPCILSNNTAHKIICKTSYVKSVNLLNIENIAQALEEVYNNYDYYLHKAHQGREWVKQYTYKSLGNKYLNLIQPKKIILGPENIITNDYIIINSEALFHKYSLIK
mgnify:CR=1 FL=1